MKTTFLSPKTVAVAFLSCCLLITHSSKAIGRPYSKINLIVSEEDPEEKKPAKKEKAKAASFAPLNNSAVKVYPDIIKRDMHVVAKDNDGKEITFFVFDVQGTLIQQYKMKAKDHYRISGLKKGKYIFRVFSGDEETATGQFDIR
jgi:hypothetical protein